MAKPESKNGLSSEQMFNRILNQIEDLNGKVDKKVSRSELFGWFAVIGIAAGFAATL